MRASRIPHPLGGRFIQVWEWAVRTIGRDAAIVMAEIDFLDRAQDAPGRPVASRARILADLEGLVGRNSVDNALRILVEAGWLKRHERRTLGPFNIQRSYEFSLDAVAIAASLGHSMMNSDSGDPDVPISESRQSPNRDQSRNPIRKPLERKEEEKEAAASSKRQIVAAAAGHSTSIQHKRRRKRPSGIVTWVPEDEVEALRIEAVASHEDIVKAIARLCRNEKQPVECCHFQIERLNCSLLRSTRVRDTTIESRITTTQSALSYFIGKPKTVRGRTPMAGIGIWKARAMAGNFNCSYESARAMPIELAGACNWSKPRVIVR